MNGIEISSDFVGVYQKFCGGLQQRRPDATAGRTGTEANSRAEESPALRAVWFNYVARTSREVHVKMCSHQCSMLR